MRFFEGASQIMKFVASFKNLFSKTDSSNFFCHKVRGEKRQAAQELLVTLLLMDR